jgi:hypothetical protein
MGVLTKLGFILLVIVIGSALLYFYDKQITTNPSGSLLNNIITTKVLPYYENATVKQDLAGIEKAIPANEIKAVRTFVNPSTDFTAQLESFNGFDFGDTNNTFVYYNGTYAPAGLFATGDIYNNGTFTNYMPWLQGKIVYVQFPVGAIGGKPPLKYVSLPYLVTKVYSKGNEFYYNFTQDFASNPILFNIENETLAQAYNGTNGALGFFYNGTEYIVGT